MSSTLGLNQLACWLFDVITNRIIGDINHSLQSTMPLYPTTADIEVTEITQCDLVTSHNIVSYILSIIVQVDNGSATGGTKPLS